MTPVREENDGTRSTHEKESGTGAGRDVPPGKSLGLALPRMTVLATCQAPDGPPNLITLSWHSPISRKPPLYGMSIDFSRASHEMLEARGEWVINFLDYRDVKGVHYCGTHSGRKVDKWEETGLAPEPSSVVAPPRVREAYAALECRLFQSVPLGDHTWFTGEVVAAWHREGAFADGVLDPPARPLFYLGKNTYDTSGEEREAF